MAPFSPSYEVQHRHQAATRGESVAVLGWLRLPGLRGDTAAACFPSATSPESLALRHAVHGDARDVWGGERGSALAAAVDMAADGPQWPAGCAPAGGAPAAAFPPAANVPPAAEAAAAVGGRAACEAAGRVARDQQAAAAERGTAAAASPGAAVAPAGASPGRRAVWPRFAWPSGGEHAIQALKLPVLPPEPPLPPLRCGFSPRTAELLASLEAFKAGARVMEEARAYAARSAAA
jgi:hypothetical protein